MGHSLILGMTESGKTTLAKRLASVYRNEGIGVIVLDPLHDEWDADFQTADKQEFLITVQQNSQCAIFIDESGESVGQYDTEMHWLATRARHYGHNTHFISQRGQQLAKTVRDQCGYLFLFNCSLSDAKLLSNEWNKPELMDANALQRGEFYRVERFGPVEKIALFGNLQTSTK